VKRWVGKLSYANVAATVALFLALGGVSWAVATLPKDSVGSKQIESGAVRSSDVKDGALRESDFKGGAAGGPSAGYFASTPAAVQVGPINNQTTVQSLSLPPGSYFVHGLVQLHNTDDADFGSINCELFQGDDQFATSGRIFVAAEGAINDRASLSIEGAVTISGSGKQTVEMQCWGVAGYSETVDAVQRYLGATEVSPLNEQ